MMENIKSIIAAARKVILEIDKADKKEGVGDRISEENEAIDNLRKELKYYEQN